MVSLTLFIHTFSPWPPRCAVALRSLPSKTVRCGVRSGARLVESGRRGEEETLEEENVVMFAIEIPVFP